MPFQGKSGKMPKKVYNSLISITHSIWRAKYMRCTML